MYNDNHAEFKALVAGYLPAALALRLAHDEVAEAVALATRFKRQCPSCHHSMARADAMQQAEAEGALPVFERACALLHLTGRQVCPFWQELQVPADVLERARPLLEEVAA